MYFKKLFNCNKGQLYTLEGAITALLLIGMGLYIIQSSPLTPLTSSSSNQQVESQLEIIGNDMLIVLDYTENESENSRLKAAIIGWQGGTEFNGQTDVTPPALDEIHDIFNNIFLKYGIAYNLELFYLDEYKNLKNYRIFWNGEPSNNAVKVDRIIVLHNDDNINSTSHIPDLNTSNQFYNSVDVQLTLWRM